MELTTHVLKGKKIYKGNKKPILLLEFSTHLIDQKTNTTSNHI